MNNRTPIPSKTIASQAPESPSGIRLITSLMITITLIGAFWAGFFPIRFSNDPWWHLKTGQYLWNYFQEHGFLCFPAFDVFTYTGESTPWINHEWLADLLFYGAYAIGGLQGAITLKSLILTLTIALLILYMVRNGVSWKMACVGSVMILFASQSALYMRPPVFTYLFIVIFLHIILSFQLDEYFIFAFLGAVIAEIVWVNLHGGAVIGLILLFFWWLSELWFCIVTWLHENPTAPSFKRLNKATFILVAVTLASFINPFTYHIHLLPFKVMEDRWLVSNIGELASPNMHYTNAFEMIILGMFLLPMLRAGSIWVYEGLAIVFFGHQALNHVRHIPLFAIVAVPPLISALAEERRALIPEGHVNDKASGFWGSLSAWIKWLLNHHVDVVLAFVVICFVFGIRPGKIWERNVHDFGHLRTLGYVRDAYPVDAVNFIERYELPGRMFNNDNFAGYLIWRLAPEKYKLFTDSRFDMWGSRHAKEELAVRGVRDIPLGGYDAEENWYPFQAEYIRKKEDLSFYIRNGNLPEMPGLTEWLQSDKPYWKYVLDDQYNVNYIITYDNDTIHYYLREQFLGWYLVFHDKGYVIYLRDDPQNDTLLHKFAKNHREHLRPVVEQ